MKDVSASAPEKENFAVHIEGFGSVEDVKHMFKDVDTQKLGIRLINVSTSHSEEALVDHHAARRRVDHSKAAMDYLDNLVLHDDDAAFEELLPGAVESAKAMGIHVDPEHYKTRRAQRLPVQAKGNK